MPNCSVGSLTTSSSPPINPGRSSKGAATRWASRMTSTSPESPQPDPAPVCPPPPAVGQPACRRRYRDRRRRWSRRQTHRGERRTTNVYFACADIDDAARRGARSSWVGRCCSVLRSLPSGPWRASGIRTERVSVCGVRSRRAVDPTRCRHVSASSPGGPIGAGPAEQDPLGDAHSTAADRPADDHGPARELGPGDRDRFPPGSGPVHRRRPPSPGCWPMQLRWGSTPTPSPCGTRPADGIRAERPTRRTARDARLDGGVADAAGERVRCVPDETSEMKWDR